MSDGPTEILAECLDRMEAGASLESCLAAFPKQATELEPLLRMTQGMRVLTQVGPRPTFGRTSRSRLESQLMPPKNLVTFEGPHRHIKQKPGLLVQRRFRLLQA